MKQTDEVVAKNSMMLSGEAFPQLGRRFEEMVIETSEIPRKECRIREMDGQLCQEIPICCTKYAKVSLNFGLDLMNVAPLSVLLPV